MKFSGLTSEKGNQLMKIIDKMKDYDKKYEAYDDDLYMLICCMGVQDEFRVKEINPIKRLFGKKIIDHLRIELEKEYNVLMKNGNDQKLKTQKRKDLYMIFIKVLAFREMYGIDEIAIYGLLKAFKFQGRFSIKANSRYADEKDIADTYKYVESTYKIENSINRIDKFGDLF